MGWQRRLCWWGGRGGCIGGMVEVGECAVGVVDEVVWVGWYRGF